MWAHKIATATMLVLAVSGCTALGAGTAFAGTGPIHEKAKARAEGGSSTAGGTVAQQNTVQSSRQNNNCSNPNRLDSPGVSLTNSRATGRCVTRDDSLTAFSRIHYGPAEVRGDSAALDVNQTNAAQRGRQNNNCNNPRNPPFDVTGGRLEGGCVGRDLSFNKRTFIKGGGARAEGGSSTGSEGGAGVFHQNTAQEGRQNNSCNNVGGGNIVLDSSRLEGRCVGRDLSFNKRTFVKGGGARAEGGSSTGVAASVRQQNTAQEGRQNNNCNNLKNSVILLMGRGRLEGRCVDRNLSLNKRTFIKGGGARAEGGSSTGGDVSQQNNAQEGRQNNNCNNPNEMVEIGVVTVAAGGRHKASCKAADRSANLGTADIGGGAQATGGSATTDLFQQNTAQEGRQSSTCNNPNNLTLLTDTGSHAQTHCTAVDHSTNIATVHR
ncbi:hypothetical protein [Streptomyces sp. NPDC051776]|uniref:hypothetical protein n=1 Tax=Streptomyces sp. NPDC051776 TaxID=3155414 RepID=UPI00343A8A1C